MSLYRIIVMSIFVALLAGIVFFTVNRDLYRVKKIQIYSDSKIDKKMLIRMINVKTGAFLWEYSKSDIQDRILAIKEFESGDVSLHFPDTLRLTITVRKPVAKITGNLTPVYFIDRKGVIFTNSGVAGDFPLIILPEITKLQKGSVLAQELISITQLLWNMKKKYDVYYRSLSQIAVTSSSAEKRYEISFKTINKSITLKNIINVENVIDAITVSLVADHETDEPVKLFMADNGLFYKRED